MTEPPDELLVEMYASMLRVRLFEERVRELFANARIPGFLHTSVGQEAVAVGVASALRRDDYVLSTHRGHGHLVANAPIARVAAPNVPIPFSPPLEAFVTPGADDVVAAIRQVVK